MAPSRITRRGLTNEDINGIKDASVRKAVLAALRNDRRISDSEVDGIIAAAMGDVQKPGSEQRRRTSELKRLDNEEIKALWMIADKSSSLTPTGRTKLLNFLRSAAATELMYGKDERDGRALPGDFNFPGPGFRGEFYWRPRNLFDLAAKFHDLHYQLNGINVEFSLRSGKKIRGEVAQSRKAKADYIFRRTCEFCKVSGFWYWGSKQIFAGEDRREFVAGDGFLNALLVPDVYKKLRDYRFTLMVPLTHVAEWEENYLKGIKGDKKYSTPVPSDRDTNSGGFHHWFTKNFKPIWGHLTVGDQTGPGR